MVQRKEYSNPYRSLEAIWKVLQTYASRERPLSVREIEGYLKKMEEAPSRATIERLLPREGGLMEAMYPGVLQTAGESGGLSCYEADGKLHVVVETPEGVELARCDRVEYTAEPFRAPSYSAIDKLLKSGTLFGLKSFPFRLRCVVRGKGASGRPKYVPYDKWEESLSPEQLSKNHAPRYYYLASPLSEGEWRMFTDLVRVYPYITEKQTRKFLTILARLQGKTRIPAPSRYAYKRGSDEMFLRIGQIDQAIRDRRKIRVAYGEYRLEQREGRWVPVLRQRAQNGDLEAEPHALMWSNGNYYLVCKHRGMMNLRVDRILEVLPLAEKFDRDEGFDPALYRDKSPVMYPGENEFVHMRCKGYMLNTLVDFFGAVPQYATPDEAGDVEVTMSIATGGVKLFALQYADGVEVLAPEHLREEIRATLDRAREKYGGNKR